MTFAHHRFAEFLSVIDVPDQGEVVTLDIPCYRHLEMPDRSNVRR